MKFNKISVHASNLPIQIICVTAQSIHLSLEAPCERAERWPQRTLMVSLARRTTLLKGQMHRLESVHDRISVAMRALAGGHQLHQVLPDGRELFVDLRIPIVFAHRKWVSG